MIKLPLLLVIALMCGTAAVQASPGPAGNASNQRIEGRIQEASGYASGECRFEAHRIAMLMTNQPSLVNGVVGHSFEVDRATVGQRFTLRPLNEVPRTRI